MAAGVTDWCTLWPDGTWGECCRLHDVAYADPFVGKLTADWHLMTCVAHDAGWPMAVLMFAGVTLGGLPFFLRARRTGRDRRQG